MKRYILYSFVLLSLVFCACSSSVASNVIETEAVETAVVEDTEVKAVEPIKEEVQEAQVYVINMQTPQEIYDIAIPTKVTIGSTLSELGEIKFSVGYRKGETIIVKMPVYNGKERWIVCGVYYKRPPFEGNGFAIAPIEASNWVKVARNGELLVPPRNWKQGTSWINITFCIPEEVDEVPEKWEFQITVRDITQVGQVQTALSARFLIAMK